MTSTFWWVYRVFLCLSLFVSFSVSLSLSPPHIHKTHRDYFSYDYKGFEESWICRYKELDMKNKYKKGIETVPVKLVKDNTK